MTVETLSLVLILTAYIGAGIVLAAVVIGCFWDGWRR